MTQSTAVINTNKKVIFKNCAPFPSCITEINKTQVNNAKDIDIVMPMYNLKEYSNVYMKTSGNLWQYQREMSQLQTIIAILLIFLRITRIQI